MPYPEVKDEFITLDLVLDGKSIGRYGDGEFNIVRGGNCVSQVYHEGIQRELRAILKSSSEDLLVGIPRLDPRSPKNVNWLKQTANYGPFLRDDKTYYSAFITRPDSAPWIATDEFYHKVESLWRGKDVTMVYGSERSLSRDFHAMSSAKSVTVVETPRRDAYTYIDDIEKRILAVPNDCVLLMCGPTATCLAYRLAAAGRHAVDLGHIGMWWMAHCNDKLIPQLRLAA